MAWLLYYGHSCLRINRDDKDFQIISITKEVLKVKTSYYEEYDINQGDIVWARRPGLYNVFVTQFSEKNDYNKKVFRFIENRDYNESAYWWIYNNCCCMISPFSYNVNKINVIELAGREGVSMLGISTAAESIGFRTIGVHISFEQLVEAPAALRRALETEPFCGGV